MNPKVVKLREEREKNVEKIASLQARNKKIDADIIKIENSDILGMVHEFGLSPDALYELIDSILPPFNLMEMMKNQDVQH